MADNRTPAQGFSSEKASTSDSGVRFVASYTPKLADPDQPATLPYVRDIIDYGVVRLRSDLAVYSAIEILLQKKVTSAVVVDEENRIVGMLSEKDCLKTFFRAAYENLPVSTVADYMSTDVNTVTLDMDIMSVVGQFLKNAYRRLPVVDENGKLLGQVTRRDLLRLFRGMLTDKKHGSFY